MSHFTNLKTRMVNKELLQQALKDLGYTWQEGEVEVFGLEGVSTPVEFKITRRNPEYEVGFRKTEEGYEIVSDLEGMPPDYHRRFVQQLTQRYAYQTARTKLEQLGFALATEEVEENGRIRLVLRRTG